MTPKKTPKQSSVFERKLNKGERSIKKPIGIGVDFGTSNSAAAFFDGKTVTVISIDDNQLMPSATYLNREYKAITGQTAIEEYISKNTGRRISLTPIHLGEARTSTGEEDNNGNPKLASTREIFSPAMEDKSLPGRLLYGIKQLLARNEDREITVFNKQYKLEALITPILLRMRQSLQTSVQQSLTMPLTNSTVTVGHPVNFERSNIISQNKEDSNGLINEEGNTRALDRLAKAYTYAGFGHQSFCNEPIAAAISYLHEHENNEQTNNTYLIVDFGGGTLDLCVVETQLERFHIKATHGIGLGGNHIDQTLYKEIVSPLLGKNVKSTFAGLEDTENRNFHFSDYEASLLNWPISYLLNQNETLTPIQHILKYSDNNGDKAKLQRLLDLIRFNYSYTVLQHLKTLKESLSTKEEAQLDIPELDINITVTQDEFSRTIQPHVTRFDQAIHDTLQKSDLGKEQIDKVICVGGSSQIPAMQQVLQKHFANKVEDHEIFTSVAAGLAIYDYDNSANNSK